MIRSEEGQTAPEYLGVMAAAVAVVMVLILSATSVGSLIFAGIEAAICRITGGTCTTAQILAKPTEPCNINVHSAEAKAGVTIFSVDLGARGKWTKTQRSDGTYQVTVEGGGNLGVKFGEGGGAHLSLGGAQHVVGDQAQLTVDLTGTGAHTWNFTSASAADEFYTAATHEPVKQVATSWLGPLQGAGMWVANQIDGHSWNPPTADESFYEGGVSADFTASGSAGALSGNVDVKASAVLGVKTINTGPDKGTKTVYIKVGGEGSATGSAGFSGTPISFDAGGKLTGEGVVSLTYDPQGKPKEIKIETAGQFGGSAGLGSGLEGKDAKAVLASLKKIGTDSSSSAGKKGVISISADLGNPTNLAATADLLHSLGVPALGGDGSANPDGARALSTLYDQFNNPLGGTHLSITTYNTTGNAYGGGAQGGEGVEFGITGDLTIANEQISSASYYVPGQGMVTWKECHK